MRIVLDTNVVISALLWRGTPYRLLSTIRDVGDPLYASTALLEELADVLARPFAAQRLALIQRTAASVLADYIEVVELVEKGRRVKLKCECHVGETLVLDGEGLLSVPPTPKWRADAP